MVLTSASGEIPAGEAGAHTSDSDLAYTGVEAATLTWIALILLIAGSTLLFVSRGVSRAEGRI